MIKKILYYPLVIEIFLMVIPGGIVYCVINFRDNFYDFETAINWAFSLIVIIFAFFIGNRFREHNELSQKISELSENILITQTNKGGELFKKIMSVYKNQLIDSANKIKEKEKLPILNTNGEHHQYICEMISDKRISSFYVMEIFDKDDKISKDQRDLDKGFMDRIESEIGKIDNFDFKWLLIKNNDEHIKDYCFYKMFEDKCKFKFITVDKFRKIIKNLEDNYREKTDRVYPKIGNGSLDIGIYLGKFDKYVFDGGHIENIYIKQWGELIAKKEIIEFYEKLFNDAWDRATEYPTTDK